MLFFAIVSHTQTKSVSGQFVEKKVRAISMRNPRLGLIVQKKISDCVFEASMELLEIDVSFKVRNCCNPEVVASRYGLSDNRNPKLIIL